MRYTTVMSPIDGLSLDLLRAFVALLDERHVTRAARRLGMTQSATSHALARLRAVLGDPLFVRGPRGVVATERAEALGPEVREILMRVEALGRASAPFDPARMERRFAIGGADYAEMMLMPKLVSLLGRDAPGVDVVFRPAAAQLEEALARGQLDLVIGVFTEAPPRLVTRKLFDEDFVCLFRRGHPALSRPLTARRWAALRHVLVSPSGEGSSAVDRALAARKLSRRVVVRTATFQTAPLLVESSDCVTTLPRRIAEVMAKGRRIELVPPPIALPRFAITLAFHERSRSDAGHAWLRERLTEIGRAT